MDRLTPRHALHALIEQFRVGVVHQRPDPWLVEIIAGMIDTDETSEAVVLREAHEAAGPELDELRPISHYLDSEQLLSVRHPACWGGPPAGVCGP